MEQLLTRASPAGRSWLLLPSVFLTSYAVLTLEVALTRIFSVMLSYHFVFAIVSTALLGLGVGAMLLKKWGGLLGSSASRVGAILFSLLIGVSVLLIISLPKITSKGFWIYLLLAALPFGAAGFAISGIFQQFAAKGPLLYGADLLGAALGALVIVPLLDAFGAVNAVFFAGAAASLGALLLGFAGKRFPALALGCFVLVSATIAFAGLKLDFFVPVTNDQYKEMYSLLSNPAYKAKIVESRWSSFGRTDLVKSELYPNEMSLFVDGGAPSTMYNLKAVLNSAEEKAHLTMHFAEFFPLSILEDGEKRSALIIGPGGGRDVVVAILGGVQAITAVEVNPDAVQIVRDYQGYSGGIYSGDPNIRVVVDEGRNFTRHTDQQFDLIMLSLPVTRSSRSIEGYALTENYLFTVEAFEDYLSRLTPGGRIIIVAHNDAEVYRLIASATSALGKRGIAEREALNHIYTVASDMKPAIVIKKQPLTPAEAEKIHEGLHRMGFDKRAFFVPYVKQAAVRPSDRIGAEQELQMFDQYLLSVAAGKVSMEKLSRTASLDVRPVTDNRPFFYKFERGLPKPFGTFAFLTVVGLGALAVLVLRRKKRILDPSSFRFALLEQPGLKLFLLLFSALGGGYMLVEIAFFQRLMLYIGQPAKALTVLLFSLLLGGGLGSLLASLIRKRAARAVAFISLATALLVALASSFFPRLFALGLGPQATATAILFPLGVLMGFPFPLAIRQTDVLGMGAQIPVMWGVNGIASVLGSALAMIVGMTVGFSWALLLGALLYVLAAVLFFRLPEQNKVAA